jgi:hypothetical protein
MLSRLSTRALPIALGSLVAVHAGVLLYHVARTLAFPYDLNYGEGYLLFDAVRLSRGEPIYADLQNFPMVRSPYPPLFPWLWSLIVPLAGPALWPGRLLSVLALVGIVALVATNALRVRCGIWPAVAAAGLVVASPFVYDWTAYARVDMLALLFAAAGVAVAQRFGDRRGWTGVLGAALLCGLAIWTKQTTVTAALAVAIALTLRSPRRGAAFLALLAIPSGIALLALDAATHGEFVRHVLEGNSQNPVLPVRAVIFVGFLAALHLPALAGGLWWLRRALGGMPSPIALYLPISLVAALSAGNAGSSVNYLIEPVIALALVVPYAWRAVPSPATGLAPLLAVVQLVLLLHWPNGFGTGYLSESTLGHTPTDADAAIGAHLDDVVRGAPGGVIAEPAAFAVRAGLPIYMQPIDLRAEQLLGRWQSGPLVDALAGGRFALVLTAYNFFPADVERAIVEHFVVSETLRSPDGLTFVVYRYVER